MYIENEKTICSGCFKETHDENVCPHCGRTLDNESASIALKKGTTLKEKYTVGRLIYSDDLINRYIAYDKENEKIVSLTEYMPKMMASRVDSEAVLNIPDENNFTNYNNGLQMFSSSANFFKEKSDNGLQKCLDIFYENFTAYAVFENVQGPTLGAFMKNFQNNKELIANLLQPILIGLDKLHRAGYNFGQISPMKIIFRDGSINSPVLCDPDLYSHIDLNMPTYCFTGKLSVFSPLEAYMTKHAKSNSNDIYALCLSIYSCFDGKVAAELEVNKTIDTSVITDKGFSPKLAAVFSKACAERFEDRYLNAYEVLCDIGLRKKVPPRPTKKDTKKAKKQNKQRNILLVCAAFFTVILILLVIFCIRFCGNSSDVSSVSDETENNSGAVGDVSDDSTSDESTADADKETDAAESIPDDTDEAPITDEPDDGKKPEESDVVSDAPVKETEKEDDPPVTENNVPEKTVKSISVSSAPSKTQYTAGDKLSTTGLKVKITYSDGTSKTITSGFTTSPANGATLSTSDTNVTVTYEGKTASYNITVQPLTVSSISIASQPSKTSYNEGDALSTSGLKIEVAYNNGTTKTVSSGFTTSPANGATLSTSNTKVTVTYEGKTTSYEINVAENVVELDVISIIISKTPAKTTYNEGDTLDIEGLEITVIYSDGTSETISSGFTTSPAKGATLSTADTKVTVTYESKETSFDINVQQVSEDSTEDPGNADDNGELNEENENNSSDNENSEGNGQER